MDGDDISLDDQLVEQMANNDFRTEYQQMTHDFQVVQLPFKTT